MSLSGFDVFVLWIAFCVFVGWLAKVRGHKTAIAWGGATFVFGPVTLIAFLIVDWRKRRALVRS